LRSDHSEKIHIQKSRKKNQAWFLPNPFCNARGCVYWWKWNPFCNIKDAMYRWKFNLIVIYGMWWNLNPACNIFCQRYYRYSVYILLQFSFGQETRTNEPASPLLRARDED
jgi:hypothetical protein